MELNWKNMKKIMAIVAFGIILYVTLLNWNAVYLNFKNIFSICTPFILGAGIAFVVNIPMKIFERNKLDKNDKKGKKIRRRNNSKMKRFFSIILSLLLIILVISVLLRLVIPELVNVIKNFIQYLTTLPSEIKPFLDEIAVKYPELETEVSKWQLDFSNILNSSIEFLKNAGTGIFNWLGKTISSTVSGIANLIVGIIFAFYILMSKEKIAKNLKKMVIAYLPEKISLKTLEIAKLSKEAFTNFITGQLKEAVILGTLCFIGMTILRIPYSLTISLLTMVTALIPIFGAIFGATVGVILLLAVSPVKAIVFLVFLIILQQIETNLIYPKVVGKSIGLPGIVVLVSITIGGSLWGVLGMLVSLPIASVIYTLLRCSINKKLKQKGIDENVFEHIGE